MTATPVKRLPRRYVIGALLTGGVVAGLAALGLIGAGEAPVRETFRFSRGVEFAPGERERLVAFLTDRAADPSIRFRITGHSGTQGDAEANIALSLSRAETVAEVFQTLSIPDDRVEAVTGIGGAAPEPKEQDEGMREHQRRLARVSVDSFPAR